MLRMRQAGCSTNKHKKCIRDSAVSGDTVNISLDNAGEDSTPEHATLVQFYTRIFFYFCKNDKLILDFAIKKDMR